jgi:hypothetical protein
MEQYNPAGRVNATQFVEINRRLTGREFESAMQRARAAGLRLDYRRPTDWWSARLCDSRSDTQSTGEVTNCLCT